MVDKVQPLKLEDSSTGGIELDQFPTGLDPQEDHVECAGLVLADATNRDEAVRIWRVGDDLTFKDTSNPTSVTLTDLLTGSGGLTEESHRLLDQLTHQIDETSFDEIIRTGGKVTGIIVWETASKLKKIREEAITRTAGKVTQLVTMQYDSAGLLKETLTEVFSRTGSVVSSITRVRT